MSLAAREAVKLKGADISWNLSGKEKMVKDDLKRKS
jgi:hypothetical protein